jgi:glutathione synthase/RimK-type ligase-like ATP-grasp enzyme
VIAVWGIPGDDPLDAVLAALADIGADARLLDQRTLGEGVDVCEIDAMYLRPQHSSAESRAADASLLTWADTTNALVVNRPSAMALNGSKPAQLAVIAQMGLDVPDTLVTTDPDEVRRFHRLHGQLIYKSVSGVRSIVARLDARRIDRLEDVANCPTQFQQFVPGDDVRVHVVGDQVFATLVRSDADDYRYGGDLEIAETEIPIEVAQRCVAAAAAMELHVAGIDLRRTPEGRWYCFEANPSPAFTFYEHATGQPIARAIARLLSEFALPPAQPARPRAAPQQSEAPLRGETVGRS